MAFEDTDRRRSAIMVVLTLIVLPVAYFLSRPQADGGTGNAGATVPVTSAPIEAPTTGPPSQGSSSRPPLEPSDDRPVFLEGPDPDENRPVLEIAVPPRPDFEPIRTTASHRRRVADPTICLTNEVDSGTNAIVTNVDNRRSVECVTAIPSGTLTAGVVLHPDAFSTIADLTDAPIPVEISAE